MVFRLLHQLPEELLQDVLLRLDTRALAQLAVTSHWGYAKSASGIWKEVNLVDCRSVYIDWDGYDEATFDAWDADGQRRRGGRQRRDEHDDSPIIKKLVVLANKPWIAEMVQTLNHRCHLPPPATSGELSRSPFSSQTLSTDPRTLRLAQLACRNMTKLQTLRIIFGHPSLNDVLLRTLFDRNHPRSTPIRKLWLENCRISAGCQRVLEAHPFGTHMPLVLDFSGLESVRIRRVPLQPGVDTTTPVPPHVCVYARSNTLEVIQDGVGGTYETTENSLRVEQGITGLTSELHGFEESGEATLLKSLFALANQFDDKIYARIMEDITLEQRRMIEDVYVGPHWERSLMAYRGSYLDPVAQQISNRKTKVPIVAQCQRERSPSADVALDLLHNSCSTLTSLCLDWVFTTPSTLARDDDVGAHRSWIRTFNTLFSLRFPHLRAFQFRNAVVADAQLPHGLFLLDHSRIRTWSYDSWKFVHGDVAPIALSFEPKDDPDLVCLRFMEAHPNLQCLAWPMHAFFSADSVAQDIASRVEAVIENLGRKLVDLRVETEYSGQGEAHTESVRCAKPNARERRRHFIERFASQMTRLESIKIEGGIPQDERRELIRAVHACPIRKLVIIGVSSALGNTWGLQGQDRGESLNVQMREGLEAEEKAAIHELGIKDLVTPTGTFRATYGWPAGPPQLHTIATYHASGITELKICGFRGSPCLLSPTPITAPMLYALKHFHRLETLILSLWLDTHFEGEPHDAEIIDYWINARTPASTALVRVSDEEPEGWERELRTKFAPDALARHITGFIGQYLSEEAKRRPGGVHVRASFCVGDFGGLFDVDVHIGQGGLGSKLLSYEGPREDLEPRRRRAKLEGRAWF